MLTMLPLLAMAQAAAAQPQGSVTPANPAGIVALLQREGYKAKLEKDQEGDPMISSAAGGSEFQVLFYDCTNHINCGSLTFHAGYDADKGKEPSADTIVKFNREWRYGRAFLDDDKDPILEYDIAFGGLPMADKMFVDNLDAFVSTMGSFEKAIDW